jgi:hypothetical protein
VGHSKSDLTSPLGTWERQVVGVLSAF